MRLRAIAMPLVAVLAAASLLQPQPGSEGDAVRVPKQANITAACNPQRNGAVNPERIDMTRLDHVEWRSVSPKAVSFTITPKDPGNWPWAETSFSGTADSAAVTPAPLPSAQLNHPYAYNVTVRCDDGSTEVIDPDIIIGT